MPGRTALGLAAARCDLAMMELLLAAGARVEDEDDLGLTALDHARSCASVEVSQKAAAIALLEKAFRG